VGHFSRAERLDPTAVEPPAAAVLAQRPDRGVRATFGLMQCGKQDAWLYGYSITSSARASSVGGTWRSSALAVLRLITRLKLDWLLDR
jgi:hypothetical protein